MTDGTVGGEQNCRGSLEIGTWKRIKSFTPIGLAMFGRPRIDWSIKRCNAGFRRVGRCRPVSDGMQQSRHQTMG